MGMRNLSTVDPSMHLISYQGQGQDVATVFVRFGINANVDYEIPSFFHDLDGSIYYYVGPVTPNRRATHEFKSFEQLGPEDKVTLTHKFPDYVQWATTAKGALIPWPLSP